MRIIKVYLVSVYTASRKPNMYVVLLYSVKRKLMYLYIPEVLRFSRLIIQHWYINIGYNKPISAGEIYHHFTGQKDGGAKRDRLK